jgi:hypothetical protein
MAQFAIEIADVDVARVLNAVAANYGRPTQIENPDYDSSATIANPDYDPNVPESPDNTPTIPDPNQVPAIDNPESLAQFANRAVRQFLAENVAAHEIRAVKEAAAESADTSIDISDPLG